MGNKVTIIIGEPATGKSTIMKTLITNHGQWVYDSSTKYIPCHWQDKEKCIIGRYDDMTHQFPGTDRMSMACQQYVINFIKDHPDASFIIEGDRLSNKMFFWALRDLGYDLVILHVWLRQDLLDARRLAERPDQGPTFIKSRVTKIKNLLNFCQLANIPVVSVENTDPEISKFIAEDLHQNRF